MACGPACSEAMAWLCQVAGRLPLVVGGKNSSQSNGQNGVETAPCDSVTFGRKRNRGMGQALLLIADSAGECMGHDASCCSCMLGWRKPDLASVIATAHLAVLPQGQCRQADATSAAARPDCWQPLWVGGSCRWGVRVGAGWRHGVASSQVFCFPCARATAKCNPCQMQYRTPYQTW